MVKIYTNHSTHNLICEYLNARDIDFDFISNQPEIPKHDQLDHYVKNNPDEKVFFLVTKDYFIDLVDKMPSNSILERATVILYDNDMEPYWSQMILDDIDRVKRLNAKLTAKVVAFVDYKPGKVVRQIWNNLHFERFNYTNFYQFDGSFLGTLKNKGKVEKDYFYTVIAKNDFRKQMLARLESKGLVSKSFNLQKVSYTNKPFEDLYQSYGKLYVDTFNWPAALPPLTFYNRTNFELAFECLGLLPNDDSFHITEKVLKPIALKHPFVMATTPNFLSQLKQEGFKTFEGIIDESYDQEYDTTKRIEMICESIKKITDQGSDHIYEKCLPICQHNYDVYISKLGSYKAKLWQDFGNFFKKYLEI